MTRKEILEKMAARLPLIFVDEYAPVPSNLKFGPEKRTEKGVIRGNNISHKLKNAPEARKYFENLQELAKQYNSQLSPSRKPGLSDPEVNVNSYMGMSKLRFHSGALKNKDERLNLLHEIGHLQDFLDAKSTPSFVSASSEKHTSKTILLEEANAWKNAMKLSKIDQLPPEATLSFWTYAADSESRTPRTVKVENAAKRIAKKIEPYETPYYKFLDKFKDMDKEKKMKYISMRLHKPIEEITYKDQDKLFSSTNINSIRNDISIRAENLSPGLKKEYIDNLAKDAYYQAKKHKLNPAPINEIKKTLLENFKDLETPRGVFAHTPPEFLNPTDIIKNPLRMKKFIIPALLFGIPISVGASLLVKKYLKAKKEKN